MLVLRAIGFRLLSIYAFYFLMVPPLCLLPSSAEYFEVLLGMEISNHYRRHQLCVWRYGECRSAWTAVPGLPEFLLQRC